MSAHVDSAEAQGKRLERVLSFDPPSKLTEFVDADAPLTSVDANMMSFALRAVAGMALASTASGMTLARSTGGLRALSTLRGGASGKEVLVTGGVGYIGSHTVLELLRADYRVVIVDNLCNSNLECLKRVQELAGKEATFYEADIRDKSAMANPNPNPKPNPNLYLKPNPAPPSNPHPHSHPNPGRRWRRCSPSMTWAR